MNTPIIDMLYKTSSGTRFHMPGHKGRLELLGIKAGRYDITEIPGSDNLFAPDGVIADSQKLFAQDAGAENCFFSVNGSSAGVIAAIMYAVKQGEKIIVARDMHISAINGIKLSGAVPIYVEMDQIMGEMPQAVSAMAVCSKIRANKDAKAVFVTYPNYYGMCADLEMIIKTAHKYKMKVIVDSAHGAHFPYSEFLPKSAGDMGADIWIVSAHKTLPALNQCAMVFSGINVDETELKSMLNMVQTTSPSYMLMASLDYARAYMKDNGSEAIRQMFFAVRELKTKIENIEGLRVEETDDFTRLIIDVSKRNITGFHAENILFNSGVFVEGADERHLILILSVFDTKGDFEALLYALKLLPKGCTEFDNYQYTLAQGTGMTPRAAMNRLHIDVPPLEAVGKIAAQSIVSYPPGVPLLIEGQIITEEHIQIINEHIKKGYNIPGYTVKLKVVER